jgi:uncharacterized protein (TIGR03382 family)
VLFRSVGSSEPSHLTLDGRRLEPDTVELAGSFDAPTVVRAYRVDVPAGGRARLALRPDRAAVGTVDLELPARVDVGEVAVLRPRRPGPRPSAWAWSFGDETFAAGERVRHRFTRLGPHRVRAVRADGDGSVAQGLGRVRVDTAVRRGCAAGGGPVGIVPILPAAALLWLISVARRRGNSTRARGVAGCWSRTR